MGIDLAAKLGASLLPVSVFLGALLYLDSYKLVRPRRVLFLAACGILAALASYEVNQLMMRLELPRLLVARVIAPIGEELLKAVPLFVLIRARRVGFTADAAILGFAAGTGFALAENLYFIAVLESTTPAVWIVRGFGTAMMHGGATAVFAMAGQSRAGSLGGARWQFFAPGLFAAVLIHAIYNHFLIEPLLSAVFVVAVLPSIMTWVFARSEKRLRAWLGSGFDLDNELLRQLHAGEFGQTPIGLYLRSLRAFYSGEVLADMLCYLRLHTELSLRAKGLLMMREHGFDVRPDASVLESLRELRYLEGAIGRTAMSSLTPILRGSGQDLWQLEVLGER
jgi:protease PrsW